MQVNRDLEKQFINETKTRYATPTDDYYNKYIKWLEEKAIQLQAGVKVNFAEIIDWHKEKFPTADKWDVYCKLLEEVGELGKAIAKQTDVEIEMEYGDVNICLIVLEHKLKLDREKAVDFSHAKNLAKEPI